jgi:hypothetical protein
MQDWLGGDELEIGDDSMSDKKRVRLETMKNAFSGVEEAMNLPVGSTPMPKGIAKHVKKNTEVAINAAKEILADPDESFEDKQFLREVIKVQIIKMQSTLEIMEGNLMVGSEPRMFEVYADLNRSVLDGCTRLMALQKQSENAKMMKGQPNDQIVLTETKSIKATGSGMSEFLEQLKTERNGTTT